jgi:hypothetical protein
MDPDEGGCPQCGSFRVVAEEGSGPTGVTHPDGGAEWQHWRIIRCLDCGEVEEL